jgi:outer membrane receptor protein involved in Fe transport
MKVNKELSFSVVAYRADYSNVIGTRQVTLPDGSRTNQFQPIGRQEIWGLQGEGTYRLKQLYVWGNFTVTEPKDLQNNLRTSDIADFMFNLGGNYQFSRKLNANLTANYVGPRKTGEGTSGSLNPTTLFDPYLILNAAISYQNIVNGVTLQLTINNITDKEYFFPGIREANNVTFASRLPQERRNISLGLLFDIH